MNQLTLTAITAILSLIEQVVVPFVTKGGTTQQVNQIIDTIEKILPAIGDQVSAIYQTLKNILSALQAASGSEADQLARVQALDAQVDAAFEAAAADVDPDKPQT